MAENWDAGIPLVIERNVWDISVKKSFDVSLMEEVENLEYRVYHSSLQVKVRVFNASLQEIIYHSSHPIKV